MPAPSLLLQRLKGQIQANPGSVVALLAIVFGLILRLRQFTLNLSFWLDEAMLALNISHGLWATAVGLSTAVPATIYFFYFKNKATKIILGMEALTLDIIKSLRNVEVVEN